MRSGLRLGVSNGGPSRRTERSAPTNNNRKTDMRNDDNPFAMAFGCVVLLVGLVFGAVFYAGGWLTVISVVMMVFHAIFGGH